MDIKTILINAYKNNLLHSGIIEYLCQDELIGWLAFLLDHQLATDIFVALTHFPWMKVGQTRW